MKESGTTIEIFTGNYHRMSDGDGIDARNCCLCGEKIELHIKEIYGDKNCITLAWKHLENDHPAIALELISRGYSKRLTPWRISW